LLTETGLKGRYDVELTWTLMDDAGNAPQSDSPAIVTALQEPVGAQT
jgi:hypothetical protein